MMTQMDVTAVPVSSAEEQGNGHLPHNGLQAHLQHSRMVLEEVGKRLSTLAALGGRDEPEYQEALGAFHKLAEQIKGIGQQLHARHTHEASLQAVTQVTGVDFSGVQPVKMLMAPAGRSGALFAGPEVSNLQRFLKLVGYQVAPTGHYDFPTRAAVQQLQAKHKLPVDGVVGAGTRKLINDMLKGA